MPGRDSPATPVPVTPVIRPTTVIHLAPAARTSGWPSAKRALRYPARMILGAGMSLAVTLLERRIRGALAPAASPAARLARRRVADEGKPPPF